MTTPLPSDVLPLYVLNKKVLKSLGEAIAEGSTDPDAAPAGWYRVLLRHWSLISPDDYPERGEPPLDEGCIVGFHGSFAFVDAPYHPFFSVHQLTQDGFQLLFEHFGCDVADVRAVDVRTVQNWIGMLPVGLHPSEDALRKMKRH